jgi:hypothetical protein
MVALNNQVFEYFDDWSNPESCLESFGPKEIKLLTKKRDNEGFYASKSIEVKDLPNSGTKRYIDDSRKIVLDNSVPYGHFIATWLYVLLRSIESEGPMTVLMYVKPDHPELVRYHTTSVITYMYEELTKRGHKVEYIDSDEFYVNNLIHVKTPFAIKTENLKPVSDFLIENLSPSAVQGQEKIYLSRGKGVKHSFSSRIDDESALEEYLKTLGFTVLYPEDFKSYRDQLDRIASARMLMSITSSALYSLMVLQPHTLVVELPVLYPMADNVNPDGTFDLRHAYFHDHYRNLATIRNNIYLAISNKNSKTSQVVEAIEGNLGLKELLSS